MITIAPSQQPGQQRDNTNNIAATTTQVPKSPVWAHPWLLALPHTCTNYQILQLYLLNSSRIWPLHPSLSLPPSPGHYFLQSRWLPELPKSSSLGVLPSHTNTVARKLLTNANLVISFPWSNLSSSIRPLRWFKGYSMVCLLITCPVLYFAISPSHSMIWLY